MLNATTLRSRRNRSGNVQAQLAKGRPIVCKTASTKRNGLGVALVVAVPCSSETIRCHALLICLAIPIKALGWLGRQGTRAITALVFIGIVVPPIGDVLKPFVT